MLGTKGSDYKALEKLLLDLGEDLLAILSYVCYLFLSIYFSNLLEYSGAGWILLKNWLSYVFVPPFPGYISGHSTFCASWAQVMHSITGDAFLPGGLSEKFFSPGMLKVPRK